MTLNWGTGLDRVGFVAALSSAIANFIYATQEGLLWGWMYLSNGCWIQKQIAYSMVKFRLGKMPDLMFILAHSALIFLVVFAFFKIFRRSIVWILSGFQKNSKH